jgi:hypothetical protein
LEEHSGRRESAKFGAVILSAPTGHQNDGDSFRILAPPAGDLGREGRTGLAIGSDEQQEDRSARGEETRKRTRLAVEIGQGEGRCRGADRKASVGWSGLRTLDRPARCFVQSRLDRVEATEELRLLDEHAGQYPDHCDKQYHCEETEDGRRALVRGQRGNPADGARAGVVPPGTEDEGGQNGEKSVSEKRPPADRGSAKLSEAAAVRPLAANQTSGDYSGEHEEESKGTESAPPRGGLGNERGRNEEFRDRERPAQRCRQPRRKPETGEGLPAAYPIQDLGNASDREDPG